MGFDDRHWFGCACNDSRCGHQATHPGKELILRKIKRWWSVLVAFVLVSFYAWTQRRQRIQEEKRTAARSAIAEESARVKNAAADAAHTANSKRAKIEAVRVEIRKRAEMKRIEAKSKRGSVADAFNRLFGRDDG